MSKGHAKRSWWRETGHEQMAAAFAACLLETDGWCQGELGGRGDGRPSCMLGALMPFMQHDYRGLMLATMVADDCAGRGMAGDTWNDNPRRRAGQVIAALRTFADGGDQ